MQYWNESVIKAELRGDFMCVTETVAEHFANRLSQMLDIIRNSKLVFVQGGIFGSYARNDYKSTSDIDFCIITNETNRYLRGFLRDEAESLGIDLIFVTPEYYTTDTSNFAKHLRKDFRRLL